MSQFATQFNQKKRALFAKYYGFLNPPQQQAVATVQGPLLVLAGAGSGKTTVLVNRIGNIILFGNAWQDETLPFEAEELYEEMCAAEKGSRAGIRAVLESFSQYVQQVVGLLRHLHAECSVAALIHLFLFAHLHVFF